MTRFQRGWLRVVHRKQGRMWQLRFNKVDPATGNRKEQTTIVGSLTGFPTESACWREIDRQRLIERINQQAGTRLEVVPVDNEYFGGDVSVAGLLTGGDFLAARARVRGDFVIIPKVALKSDEPIMLDGMSFRELQEQFKVPIYAFDFPAFASAIKNGFIPKAQARISEAA